MRTLQQILDAKQRPLVTIGPRDTVAEAVALLDQHDIGALLVLDSGTLAGILSERDIVRKLDLSDPRAATAVVQDLMSAQVMVVDPTRTVEDCMAIMTQRHIRHLPVVDAQGALLGMVSIGDMVMETVREKDYLIDQLVKYISG